MQSKTSFFNRTLFFNTITRYWPLWAAYLVIWLLILPLALGSEIDYYLRGTRDIIYATQRYVLDAAIMGGVIMSAVFAVFAAMATHQFLYSARSANAFAALPVRREGVFLSTNLSGLACLFAANVLVFVVTLLVEFFHGVPDIGALFQWLGMVCLLNVSFYGFAVFLAQLTGSLLALPVLYAILSFTAVVVESIVTTILDCFVYGMYSDGGFTALASALSPAIGLLNMLYVENDYYVTTMGEHITTAFYLERWGVAAIYAGTGVVLFGIALLLYRRRHMESASDIIAVRPLRPVFKYCFTVGCGLVLGMVIFSIVANSLALYNAVPALAVSIVLGAFIGYFAAQMLLHKSFRVFKKGWPGFLITAVAMVALLVACDMDAFGFERYVPEQEQVESVNIVCNGEMLTYEDQELIAQVLDIHQGLINNKNIHDTATSEFSYYGPYDSYSRSLRLTYYMDNDRLVQRLYRVSYTDETMKDPSSDMAAIQAFFNTQAAIEQRKATEIPVTEDTVVDTFVEYYDYESGRHEQLALTPEQAVELYHECIVPDQEDGNIGRIWLATTPDYYTTAYGCNIYMYLNDRKADGTYRNEDFWTVPLTVSQRTVAWLEETLPDLELITVGEQEILIAKDREEYDPELAEKYGYPVTATDMPATSVAVIGGADGPTELYVEG